MSTDTNVNGRFDDRHGDGGRGVDFGTQEQCMVALTHSNEGFTCKGRDLITSGRGVVSYAANDQECWVSVIQAKNGFTCLGNTLFNAQHGYIAISENSRDCFDAVNASK